MTGIVVLNAGQANGLQTALDARLGYPKDSIDVGGGFHMSKAQSRTQTASTPIQHPTLLTWALPQTAEIAAVVGVSVALPGGAAVQALDSTWFPSPIGVP